MPRRKELNGIASGLFGSFISRNNDVGGYWGIGKLRLLAEQHSLDFVSIDLLTGTINPPSDAFQKLASGYSSFLRKHIAARSIPEAWIVGAEITLNFNPELPPKFQPITTWGTLFKLTVAITDDKGKGHTISGYSYCAVHDSKKERQSGGTPRF